MRKRPRTEPHVRLHRHELDCSAYRSLSPEARALLVEARALYWGGENCVHLSLREIMRRLRVGRTRAEKARDELLDRGFLRLLRPGSFNCKVRHAPEYALTNVPLDPDRDGATAPKDFMRWQPAQKSTVRTTSTVGVGDRYRETPKHPPKGPHGVDGRHRKGRKERGNGAAHQHTDSVTRGPLLRGAFNARGETQSRLILAALALTEETQEAAA